jgi:hypothetical protein
MLLTAYCALFYNQMNMYVTYVAQRIVFFATTSLLLMLLLEFAVIDYAFPVKTFTDFSRCWVR